MTAPSSIDPARFLHDQLASAPPDLLHSMLTTFVNALMSAEADAVCGAPYGTPHRTGSMSVTATGTGTSIPGPGRWRWRFPGCGPGAISGTVGIRVRAGWPRLTHSLTERRVLSQIRLLERRRRAEAALTSVVATCYLLGVSTRRMEKLVESLGITRLSVRRSARWPATLTRFLVVHPPVPAAA